MSNNDESPHESPHKTRSITVRLTETEHQRLSEEADLAGLTVSELVRRRFFGRPIIARSDEATIRELRRLGGLLKHLWTQHGGRHPETLATLGKIKATIEALAKEHNNTP